MITRPFRVRRVHRNLRTLNPFIPQMIMSVFAAFPSSDIHTVTPETQSKEADRTLLIVDDEDGPLQALQILFQDTYNVVLAASGSEAIEAIRIRPADAVILDIRMPEMSGIEVLQRIKQIDPSIEVIMLTAYETLETARQALRLGARDYLTKPFEIETIREAVATAMECKHISRKIQYHQKELCLLQEEIQNQTLRERIARTRGEIYASILHDVNGPLTVIAAYVEILNRTVGHATRIEGEALEVLKDQLHRITMQVTNCINISRRYLGFLRHSPGANTPVFVNHILNDVRQLIKARPDCRVKDLNVRFLPSDAIVSVNGTDLVQILLNLGVNAFQCSEPSTPVEIRGNILQHPLGESDFEERAGFRFIRSEHFQNVGPLLELSVRDSGTGIAQEILDRIFEPFFSTKATDRGTGLGLSIVLRLVDQSNGAVQIHTAEGKGTEFKIYLPTKESTSAPNPLESDKPK